MSRTMLTSLHRLLITALETRYPSLPTSSDLSPFASPIAPSLSYAPRLYSLRFPTPATDISLSIILSPLAFSPL